MKFSVYTKPGSKYQKINWDGERLIVRVRSHAHEGKANRELIKVLADLFNVTKNSLDITSGQNAKVKIISLDITDKQFESIVSRLTPSE